MRAVKDSLGHSLRREGVREDWKALAGLMACPGESIAKQSEGRAGEKCLPVGGRVRKLRAVEDQSAPIREGGSILQRRAPRAQTAWVVDWVPVWVDVGVRYLSLIFIAHLAPNSFLLNKLAEFSRSATLIHRKGCRTISPASSSQLSM